MSREQRSTTTTCLVMVGYSRKMVTSHAVRYWDHLHRSLRTRMTTGMTSSTSAAATGISASDQNCV